MTDKPVRHIDEDGAIYAAEILPPEHDGTKYHVDLVRTSVDDTGLGREQRLTVGQHNSWMEAEEQLYEVEDALEKDGIAGWDEDAGRLRQQPFADDVFYMTAVYPPDTPEGHDTAAQLLAVGESGIASSTLAVGERELVEAVVNRLDAMFAEEGTDRLLEAARIEAELNGDQLSTIPLFDRDDGAVRHIDGGGTAHWFAITEREDAETEPYELRYFRALEMEDGMGRGDSYAVMPLPDDDPGSAWALPGLEMYLEKGDVYMTQQFAHDVADAYGQEFPEPLNLPALDSRPEYYFGYGVGQSNSPSLEAVKTWMDGAERRFDTLTVGEYGSFDEAAVVERELETLLDEKGVQAAMNLAETMAEIDGYLDPNRDDPRLFTQGPPDPFVTKREEEIDNNLARYGVTWRETQEWASDWQPDELGPDIELSTEPQPYWRLDTLPVKDPDGEPLGHALHMVVYDGVEHDPEIVGTPAIPEDEPFRMLEFAHFETTEAAEKFGEEFNGYLMPGLLEGPELAEEVARLEGHSVEWKTPDGQELADYRDLKLTLTRNPSRWQPYNPNAERDARIEAEGLYTDPIHQFTMSEDDNDGKPYEIEM